MDALYLITDTARGRDRAPLLSVQDGGAQRKVVVTIRRRVIEGKFVSNTAVTQEVITSDRLASALKQVYNHYWLTTDKQFFMDMQDLWARLRLAEYSYPFGGELI